MVHWWKQFRIVGLLVSFLMVNFLVLPFAYSTPSTHVWSPSTDIQAHGTGHITADVYVPVEKDSTGSKPNTVTNLGLTFGYWPIKDKVGIEMGFDHITGFGSLDDYPFSFNAKAGISEDALFQYSPAFAVGAFGLGTEKNKTDNNILYIKTAKTFLINNFNLGRTSVGYFWGNDKLLLDKDGRKDSHGILVAWERVMKEFSDKLWICVDYQGTESGFGALAPGFSWKFADNVSLLFGYVIPNNSRLANTFTVQCDIDFDIISIFKKTR